jgi:hypothetical protein
MAEVTEYEVRCPRCNVSFPVGTRTCLHCGGRTMRGEQAASLRRGEPLPSPFEPRTRGAPGEPVETGLPRPLPVDVEQEEEEQSTRGRLLRAGVTVLWILLAIGFSAARACSER